MLEMCDGEVRSTEIYCKLAALGTFVSEWTIERFPGCWNLRVRNKQHPSLWFAVCELEPNMLTTMQWNDSGVVFCWYENTARYLNVEDLVKHLTQLAKAEAEVEAETEAVIC